MTIEFIEKSSPARIRVIGVGGCGGNIVRYLQERAVAGIEYAAVNTDSQALSRIEGAECVHIGGEQTRGLGTGAKPDLAADAAESAIDRLKELVRGYDMVFVAAGMGKGTGTGASPVVARLARDAGALTVAVATLPFSYERRDDIAARGMDALGTAVDSLLAVPNAKLQQVLGEDAMFDEALAAANEVLYNAVCGISEIITKPGDMNLDFNDVRAVMSAKGKAVMGSACKGGDSCAADATEEAVCCPLMEDVDLSAASHFLVNITAAKGRIRLSDTNAVHDVIDQQAPDCKSERFVGMVFDDSMGDKIRVSVIATGIQSEAMRESSRAPVAAVAGGGGTLQVLTGGDSCFSSGRDNYREKQLLESHGGDARKVPTIIRRQRN